MGKKEYRERLWKEYLEERGDLAPEQRAALAEIGRLFWEDVTFLYAVHKCLVNHGGAMEDERTGIQYETADEYHILRQRDVETAFTKTVLKGLVTDMIMLFEDILPLGSVVDLKRDYLKQKLPIEGVKQVRMVITRRFLDGGQGTYFPYAAVVYPVAPGGEQHSFCFTPAVIARVVHEGYSDEVEEAFIYQMKHQLVITEKRKSRGFIEGKEQEEMEQAAFSGGNGNGEC